MNAKIVFCYMLVIYSHCNMIVVLKNSLKTLLCYAAIPTHSPHWPFIWHKSTYEVYICNAAMRKNAQELSTR